MQTSITQCRHLLSLADTVIAGLGESHGALEPAPGLKTAGWLMGHLAVSGDFARRLCGAQPLCPPEWRHAFNPGSQPSHDEATYPSIETLSRMFRAVYDDLCQAAAAADPAKLRVANPYVPARAAFPTAGDFVAYVLSGHLAYHLGQLVAWRAAAGFGRLERPSNLAA